jgi:O-antigen ligase
MESKGAKNLPAERKAGEDYLVPLEPEDVRQTWPAGFIVFVLCAAIVLTTIAYGTVHQPILALFYLGAVLLVILWAFDAWFSGFLRFNRSWLQLPLIGAIIIGLIQIIPFGSFSEGGVSGITRTISLDPYTTQFAVIHWLALLIYFAAALAFIDSNKRLKKVFYVITIFGFIFAFFAIIQYVLSPTKIYGIYEPHQARPFGSFVNPNNFAAYMEMTLALPLGLFFAGAVEKDKKLLYLTAITLMGVALVMSGSRGGFISLIAEVFFLVLLTTKAGSPGKLVLRLGAAAALLLCIVAGTILLGSEKSAIDRFSEKIDKPEQQTSRTHIWATTMGIIGQNPFIGSGLNAFGIAYTAHDTFSGIERAEQAHNDYLQVISDAGIVGGIIGVGFLIGFFRTGLDSVKTHNKLRRGLAVGAFAGCFAVLVHSMFDFVLHTTAIALLFMILMALVVNSRKDGAAEEKQPEPVRKREPRSDNVTPLRRRRERSR